MTPYVELTEASHVQSSSRWLSTIKYQGKGYFFRKSNTLQAVLMPPIVSGSSFRTSSFERRRNTTGKDTKSGAVFTDLAGHRQEVTVRPAEDRGE